MLRRHSTKSRSDIQRHKSTTSVRSVPLEHISFNAAQRDAKLAAIQAFSRGQARKHAETPLFPPNQGSPHHIQDDGSPVRRSRNNSVIQHGSEYDRQDLARRQSVRFVCPESGLQTQAARINVRTAAADREEEQGQAAVPRRGLYKSHSTQHVGSMQATVFRGAPEILPPDRTSSCGKTLVAPIYSPNRDYLQVLAPEPENYTQEDDVASMPSSYRRVRKTKSMFMTRKSVREGHNTAQSAPLSMTEQHLKTQQFRTGLSRPRFSFLGRREDETLVSGSPGLKVSKSTGMLRHLRHHQAGPVPSPGSTHGLPLANPENPIEQDTLESPDLPKHSILFGSRSGKLGRAMRKTLRQSSSIASLSASKTSGSMNLSLHGSLRLKAQVVSSSVKSRIKTLFTRHLHDDDATTAELPVQQVEAQRTHVSVTFPGNQFASASYESGGSLMRSSMSKVSSHVPSLHAVPSNEHLRSRKGSIESLRSERREASGDKSRVTSWASTDINTVISNRVPESISDALQGEKLAFIAQSDLQKPLSLATSHQSNLQTIASQEELALATSNGKLCNGATVDSQRVYSALMKRMQETRQLYDNMLEQRRSSDHSDPFRTLSPPSSEGSIVTDQPQEAIRTQLVARSDFDQGNGDLQSSRSSSEKSQASCLTVSEPQPRLRQQVLRPAKEASPSKPIVDRTSAFFGSPTSHLFRTRSPWRKSLQVAMERDRTLAQEPTKRTINTNDITGTAANVINNNGTVDSASNYSQETDHPFAGMAEQDDKPAAAARPRIQPSAHCPTGKRFVSTASSVEWKTTLSYDVEKKVLLSPSPTRVSGRRSEIDYVVPTMPRLFGQGHVREAAQTTPYEEDVQMRHTNPTVRMPTSAGTPLACIEPNVMKLSPQQRSILQTTPPATNRLQENVLPHSRTANPPASPIDNGEDCEHEMACNTALPQTPGHDMTGGKPSARALSQAQSYGRIWTQETGSPRPRGSPTVKLMRKAANRVEVSPTSATSTPRLSSAFERQFGTMAVARQAGDTVGDDTAAEGEASHTGETEGGSGVQGTMGNGRSNKTMADMLMNARKWSGWSNGGPAFV